MADGAVHQLQAGLDGALADLLDLAAFVNTFHMRVSAKFQIDLVSVVDQLLGKILTDQLRQLAANLIGEGQLAVRERTGTGKPVVMAQVGLQFTQWPVLSLGQWRFSTGLPFSIRQMRGPVVLLLLRSSSSAVKYRPGRRQR